MIFPYTCPRCEKDKWLIRYNVETRQHTIECAQCGYKKILEEIFGSNKRSTNGAKTKSTTKNDNKIEAKSAGTQAQ